MFLASSIVLAFNDVSPFVSVTPNTAVNNEAELRSAVDKAPTKKSYTITINKDITLTDSSLIIPPNKDIILTSNKTNEGYKLIGTAHETSHIMVMENSVSTITIVDDGMLTLDTALAKQAF
jgi:hypothetical protein